LAESGELSAAQQVSIAVPVDREWKSRGASDPGITLLELFSYLGDVLSNYQEQVANESYLDVQRGEERSSLRITLGEGLRPAVCVIADDDRVYVLTVGSDAESARVTIGEGTPGKRPLTGAEDVTAIYRRRHEDTGEFLLRGLPLGDSFAVLVLGDPKVARRCFYLWRSSGSSGS
jgi:hypothetical protein